MQRINKYIEIVRSSKAALVSLGKYSAEAMREVLEQHYETVHISVVNDLDGLKELVAKQPDLVFLGMKSLPSIEPGLPTVWVSDYLNDHGIAHTGSQLDAIKFESNKPLAKQHVRNAGLNTARSIVVADNKIEVDTLAKLQFPLFVKPVSLGGGQGIDSDSLVYSETELKAKVECITERYNQNSLVEEYLPGREFSVAILRNEYTNTLQTMPIELVAEKNLKGERFLSKTAKSANEEVVLPVQDSHTKDKVNELAIEVFKALGARDYGRVDIRLNDAGVPYFLEANLIPCLKSDYGSFQKACVINNNICYEDMILAITRLGLSHKPSLSVESSIVSPLLDQFTPIPALDSA